MYRGHPQKSIDYPRDFTEFNEWFAKESDCRDYLIKIRWPDGYKCFKCSYHGQPWITKRQYLKCPKCRSEISITSNTIFEGTRKPLMLWFQTIWFVTSQKNGASALGLQRVLGLNSYQTAWAWLHKLRRAMVRKGRDRLNGPFEVDETYIGGHESGVGGRETKTKTFVGIAVERRGKAMGRIRLQIMKNASIENCEMFVKNCVNPGSLIYTDGWAGYANLEKLGYKHQTVNLSKSDKLAHKLLPHVHRIASLLKRVLLGTHQGGVQAHQLAYYLDEFTFRFNRRSSRSRGLLFYRLMEQAVDQIPQPYKNLVGGNQVASSG